MKKQLYSPSLQQYLTQVLYKNQAARIGNLSIPSNLENSRDGPLGAAISVAGFMHAFRQEEEIEKFLMHDIPEVSDADLERHVIDFFKLRGFERERNSWDNGSGFYYKGETGLHVYISNYHSTLIATVSEWDVPPTKKE